jgi:fatty-acyl-CoA synthase
MNTDTVYLSPAPIYHAAPLGFCLATTGLGGTVVVMAHFDPLDALAALERHRCTHSQWVPTMFSRMLKLPEEDRTRFDLSAHAVAIHAAAPCPRPVKEAMFDWWGPIIHEYYGGSELNGLTVVGPQDWLAHPGTVGRAILGTLHICDEDGNELPPGEPGLVYFEQKVAPFHYHKDEEQTQSSRHPEHPSWTALGDVGYVDGDGFLFLTDRATFMIISGGVNIYPREIEDVLVMHPLVDDVAVFGVPNADMGEEVKAVVQLVPGTEGTPELASELIDYTRQHLTRYKCPRSVDFDPALPRLPTGKLYKRILRDRYWGDHTNRLT